MELLTMVYQLRRKQILTNRLAGVPLTKSRALLFKCELKSGAKRVVQDLISQEEGVGILKLRFAGMNVILI